MIWRATRTRGCFGGLCIVFSSLVSFWGFAGIVPDIGSGFRVWAFIVIQTWAKCLQNYVVVDPLVSRWVF